MPIETPVICNEGTVLKALSALKQLDGSLENVKKPLLEESCEQFIYLQVSLKKIPKQKETVQILLPHSIVKKTAEICIFTGDLEKKQKKAEIEPTVLHYKELLKSKNVVQVNEVVPLRQLRTEYKTFESRRQLASAFDIFLTDKKIAQCLPNLLGKAFYTKNKFPLQVDLEIKNLKPHIEQALSKTSFILNGHGNSCSLKVACLDMDAKKTLENIEMCIKGLSSKIPGGTDNFSGLYLKTARSKAIPIYISLEIPNAVQLERKRKREEVFEDELSTLPNAKVKVFKSGKITVTKTAYDDMDEESVEESSDNPNEVNARKKREDIIEDDDTGNIGDSSDDDIDNLIASKKAKTSHLLKASKKKNIKKTEFLSKNSPKKSKKVKTVEDANKKIQTKKKLQKKSIEKESIKSEESIVNSDKENKNTLSTVMPTKKIKQTKKVKQHPVVDTVVKKQQTEVVTKPISKKKAMKGKSPVENSESLSMSPIVVEPKKNKRQKNITVISNDASHTDSSLSNSKKKNKRQKNIEVISSDASHAESSLSNATKKLLKKEKKIKTPKSKLNVPTPQKSKRMKIH